MVDLIDRAEWLGIPSVVLGELWVGFLLGSRRERNERELEEFLAHPIVEELDVNHEIGRIYAEIVVSLRRPGRPVPSNDIWIAATAAYSGATVLTYDPHFELIQRVGSIVLPDPSRASS